MVNKDLQILALTQELDEAKALASAYEKVLSEALDNHMVQCCCICYGGSSFPGPMKEALTCFVEIVNARVDKLLNPEEA